MRYSARNIGHSFGFGSPVLPGVKFLLIANIAVFVVYFFAIQAGFGALFRPLALHPKAVLTLIGLPQLVTHLFLHDPTGFWHVLINMLILWMFGTTLESTWGTRRFLQYYFLCGIGSGLIAVFASLLTGEIDTRIIGASGAIYGLMLAFGVLFPDAPILFALLIPIKAKYFVMILGAIAFLSTFGVNSTVSHVSHLGGIIVGYLVIRSGLLNLDILRRLRTSYDDYRIRRNRKKFEVYMRKKDSRGNGRFQ